MTPTTIYRTYRRNFFFRRRRFLMFWTTKLTFITFARKNQYFVVDWLRRVFTCEKVNWPAAYSWITLDSRYMAKISTAAYLRMRLISEYIRHCDSASCSEKNGNVCISFQARTYTGPFTNDNFCFFSFDIRCRNENYQHQSNNAGIRKIRIINKNITC